MISTTTVQNTETITATSSTTKSAKIQKNNINNLKNDNENIIKEDQLISHNLFKIMKTKSIKNLNYIKNKLSPTDLSPTNSSSSSNSSNSSNSCIGDQRTMDAADTLVSLAHSANSTPTTEFKPFIQTTTSTTNNLNSLTPNIEIVVNTSPNSKAENIIEKTIKLDEFSSSSVMLSPATTTTSYSSISLKDEKQNLTFVSNSLDNMNTKNSKEIVESACKILLEQVLKSCPNVNLSSITIKATAVPCESSSSESKANETNTKLSTTTSSSSPITTIDNNNKAESILKITNNYNNNNSNNKDVKINQSDLSKQLNKKCDNYRPKIKRARLLNTQKHESRMNSMSSDSESDSSSRFSSSNHSVIAMKAAPTLATGRRSKDIELPPEEAKKRQERRERNKEAAARCRRKREELATTLSKKTDELNQEQENLKRKHLDLLNEKSRLENLLQEHEKKCSTKSEQILTNICTRNINETVKTTSATTNSNNLQQYQQKFQQEQHQNLLKIKKEELNQIIKQSHEKKINQQAQLLNIQNHINDIKTDNKLNLLTNQSNISSVALTPNSASFNTCITNILSQFEQSAAVAAAAAQNFSSNLESQQSNSSNTSNVSTLQRPNNLKIKNPILNQTITSNNLITPSPAFITSSVLQNLALVFGQQNSNNSNSSLNNLNNNANNINNNINNSNTNTNNPNMFSIGSNNNISLLMTPTLQLNTPTALLAFTPIEATLNALNGCNTPIFPQQNSILSISNTGIININESTNNSNTISNNNDNNNNNNNNKNLNTNSKLVKS